MTAEREPREDASPLDSRRQGGAEGKGTDGKLQGPGWEQSDPGGKGGQGARTGLGAAGVWRDWLLV